MIANGSFQFLESKNKMAEYSSDPVSGKCLDYILYDGSVGHTESTDE